MAKMVIVGTPSGRSFYDDLMAKRTDKEPKTTWVVAYPGARQTTWTHTKYRDCKLRLSWHRPDEIIAQPECPTRNQEARIVGALTGFLYEHLFAQLRVIRFVEDD